MILDDELPGLTYLRMLCEQIPFAEVVRCFDSPETFLKQHEQLDYDVCLLDIHMPGLNGMEVAQLLQSRPVIFVSAHPEYAIEAFNLDAIDFIKKPVSRDRLEKALSKVMNRLNDLPGKSYFIWNTNLGKSTLYFNEITYITTGEIDKRDKLVYMADQGTLLLKNITIDRLLEFLPARDFIRVNKSDIINRKAIQAYTFDEIVLKLKTARQLPMTITLGDIYRRAFQDWIL
ncbi:MAG: response regulator transcription factor [Bacteroidetes bacterium]|nr:response regulator transcription factor [Bacteroidota bacterium]